MEMVVVRLALAIQQWRCSTTLERYARGRVGPQVLGSGGLFFVLIWLSTVLGSLLRIPGLFSCHIAGIEVVFTLWVLAGLLLIWVFVICH
ncbi:hypothetical protein ABIF20_000768 [Bradyrhizobium japonicum]